MLYKEGSYVGKYQIVNFLGGGMVKVYKARDIVLGRLVAVKILTETGCDDPGVKTRFLAEVRIAGNTAHDSILGIHEYGGTSSTAIVMPLLEGENLEHAILKGELKDMFKILLQVAGTLKNLESQKMISRWMI